LSLIPNGLRLFWAVRPTPVPEKTKSKPAPTKNLAIYTQISACQGLTLSSARLPLWQDRPGSGPSRSSETPTRAGSRPPGTACGASASWPLVEKGQERTKRRPPGPPGPIIEAGEYVLRGGLVDQPSKGVPHGFIGARSLESRASVMACHTRSSIHHISSGSARPGVHSGFLIGSPGPGRRRAHPICARATARSRCRRAGGGRGSFS
jgi:hypothetical protein